MARAAGLGILCALLLSRSPVLAQVNGTDSDNDNGVYAGLSADEAEVWERIKDQECPSGENFTTPLSVETLATASYLFMAKGAGKAEDKYIGVQVTQKSDGECFVEKCIQYDHKPCTGNGDCASGFWCGVPFDKSSAAWVEGDWCIDVQDEACWQGRAAEHVCPCVPPVTIFCTYNAGAGTGPSFAIGGSIMAAAIAVFTSIG